MFSCVVPVPGDHNSFIATTNRKQTMKTANRTISAERKAELAKLGYYIEDMGVVYGSAWAGQFRWMNSITQDFQDFDTSPTSEEAWFDADCHAQVSA